ncbi:MAG: alpha-2-macroglobulin family protein, partial [Desulfovibrio sp.]|nr:alpha-2-macroglobulin family protein [Desulfovibrio sp.]
LQPDAPGAWRWRHDNTLLFTPDKPLTPDTRYTAHLEGLSLPDRVILRPDRISFTTFPQAVTSGVPRLWTDPSPKAAHALSCTLTFAYPVDISRMEQSISLRVSDPASGLRFGPLRFVWNPTRTEVNIHAPVITLGEEDAFAEIRVPGMRSYTIEDGNPILSPPAKTGIRYNFSVQGRKKLFSVKQLNLQVTANENLGQEYELVLQTSLYARPSDVLNTLRIIQLPRVQHDEAVIAYDWSSAPVVAGEALNKGKTLAVESLQPDDEPANRLRFRVRPDEGSYIFAYIPAEFASTSGIALGRPWQGVLRALPPRPKLGFLQPGNILPLKGERTLDIHSTGLTSIRWEVRRVRAPFLALLASDGERYNAFADPPVDYSMSDVSRGELRLVRTSSGEPQFSVLDLRPLLQDGGGDRRGLMLIRLSGMDGDKELVREERFVLVTDLGLMVKKSAVGERDVFVLSLSGGGPASGVLVQILGANGLPVAEAHTDARGHARLPQLDGLEREKRPVAIAASRAVGNGNGDGVDLAWMPLRDSARKVDYSSFPTAGRLAPPGGITAYVFAQRGIFRPGETLLFGCAVRRTDWKELPQDMLLQAVLFNPVGTEVMRRTFGVGAEGLVGIEWQSQENSPTGRYRLDVQLADSGKSGGNAVVLGTTAVRVEEFQPDTLELAARFEPAQDRGWLPLPDPAVVRARVQLKNLYGMPATDRRVRATLRILPAVFRFPGYEDYTFHDASPYHGEARETILPEARTGPDGTVGIPLPLTGLRAGSVTCSLLLEGFEPGGGRAVSLQRDVLLSPLKTILGYRGTEAGVNPDFIPQGRAAGLEFLALNPALEKVDAGPLHFVVYARRYVTSLVTDARGEYRFDETPVDKEYSRATRTVDARKGLRWNIPTENPGDYVLTVRNGAGEVMASVPFTVAGDGLRAGVSPVPGKLRAQIDKKDYEAGETAHIRLTTPYDGAGLITLERDGVEAHKWFRAKAGESVQSIVIPDEFEGRGYVNVSFVRDADSPDIYMSPHSYALVPFTAGIRRRDMEIRLRAPEIVRPGDNISVAVTAREAGKALVFAVDEGVLQLTRFDTPSPLDYLLRDRALSVESMQAFDLLMPEHARLRGRIPGFGGDMVPGGGRFHNPFKRRGEPPLNSWAFVDVGPQETSVVIPVPDYYNGRVRIMAVGSAPRTTGSARADTTVRGNVVLTPQMPLQVAPGDSFTASVAVANNIAGSGRDKTVYLDIEPDAVFTVEGKTAFALPVEEHGEKTVFFDVRAKDIPGEAKIRFTARENKDTANPGASAARKSSVSVRPASPRRTEQAAGRIASSTDIRVERDIYPYEATAQVAVSGLPLPAVRGLAMYLDRYPHGCVEQLVSRAFPYAVLYNRMELFVDAKRSGAKVREEAGKLIDAAIHAIQAAFHPGEGVGAWPGSPPDSLRTVYAGDFLLTLHEAGRGLPGGLADSVCDAIEKMALRTPVSPEDARIKAYGIWVLTREGRITTRAIDHLREYLDSHVPGWKEDLTGTLLAGSFAIMRMDGQAGRLVDAYVFDEKEFVQRGLFSGLAVKALRTAVLARHFPDRLKKGENDAQSMIDAALLALNSHEYSTFSAAQSIRALMALSSAAAASLNSVRLLCVEGAGETALLAERGDLLTLDAPACKAFRVETPGEGAVSLYWQLSTDGFDRRPPTEASARRMEVNRVYRNADGREVSAVHLGDEVTVRITARALGKPVPDSVIVDLLPGGFEMVLPGKGEEDGDSASSPASLRTERREDRLLLFTDLSTELFEYSYKIRAVNKGAFAIPPVHAEAMYDPTAQATSAAGIMAVR